MSTTSIQTQPQPEPSLCVALLERNGKGKPTGWMMRLEDTTMKKEDFSLSMAELNRLVDATLCRGDVNPKYIQKQINANNIYMLMFYEVAEPRRVTRHTKAKATSAYLAYDIVTVPAAFLIARIIDEKNLYIDVICSGNRNPPHYVRHNGGMLLELAIQYAHHKDLEEVSLSALPNVLTYYPRFKFAHRPSCAEPVNVELPQVLKIRAKNRTLPTNINDAYDDEDLLDYMSDLQLKHYGNKYDDECETVGKSKQFVKRSMKDARCGDEGFKMRLCLKESLHVGEKTTKPATELTTSITTRKRTKRQQS